MQTADFYSSATGTLRVNGGRDENAPQGVSLSIDDLSYIKQGSRATDSGGTGTTDYNELANKPQINSITLTGNVLLSDIGAQPKIDSSHKVSADNIDEWKNLRTIKDKYHIPIIIMSDDKNLRSKKEFKEFGCDDYFTKPFTAVMLNEIIYNMIKKSM